MACNSLFPSYIYPTSYSSGIINNALLMNSLQSSNVLATGSSDAWPTTSGEVTAILVVLVFLIAVLYAIGLYFLRRRALQYAKSTSRGRLQFILSFFYVFLIYCSLFEASVSTWLLAQYGHEDRYPTVGSRVGLRISLFSACWTLIGASVHIYFLLRVPQWTRKRPVMTLTFQAVWTLITWCVWVAATRTMTRVLPLLAPKARCAGADYCIQLQAALGFALTEILTLSVGLLVMSWASWRLVRQ